MRQSLGRSLLAVVVLLGAGAVAYAAAPAVADPDAALLRELGQATDTKSLLAFLRERTPNERELSRIDRLLEQLGDDDFDLRQEATAKLERLGRFALPHLRRHRESDDLEVRLRVAASLRRLRGRDHEIGIGPAVRLLRTRGPEAIPALLAYLPHAGCEEIEEEIYRALDACAAGALHPAIRSAIDDRAWQRRAVAGWILARRQGKRERLLASRCLEDRSAEVRLRTAQGFLAARDVRAIPVLIELLEADWRVAVQAEELLRWGIGGQGPRGRNTSAKDRVKLWRKWWQEQREELSLEGHKKPCPSPRLVLLCVRERAEGGETFSIRLVGSDGVAAELMRTKEALSDPILLPAGTLAVGHDRGLTLFSRGGKVIWRQRAENLDTRVMPNSRIKVLERSPSGCTLLTLAPTGDVEEREHFQVPVSIQLGGITPSGTVRLLRSDRDESWEYHDAAAKPVIQPTDPKLWMEEMDRIRQTSFAQVTGERVLQRQTSEDTFVIEQRSGRNEITWEAPSLGELRGLSLPFQLLSLGFQTSDHELIAWDMPRARAEQLRHPEARVRWHAVKTLGEGGTIPVPCREAFVSLLADESESIREEVRQKLRNKADASVIALLRKTLSSKNPRCRAGAIDVLSATREGRKDLAPDLIRAIDDPDATVRRSAIYGLCHLGKEAQEATGPLLRRLSKDQECRPAILHALRVLGRYGQEDMASKLVQVAAETKDRPTRTKAIVALGELGGRGAVAVPQLVDWLSAKEFEPWRVEIANALGEIGPDAAEAQKALGGLVVHEDEELACAACRALGRMNHRARPSAPLLARVLLKSKSEDVQVQAAYALGRIGDRSPEVLDALRQTANRNKGTDLAIACGGALISLEKIPRGGHLPKTAPKK